MAPLKVGLLGFGTVGRSVAKIILDQPAGPLQLTHIFNRRIERKKVDWVPRGVVWTERAEDVFESEADVVVELVGGLEPAGTWVRSALAARKSVVTANKQLIAHHGPELLELARQRGVHLRYEASVAGGIPVLAGIQDGLAGDRIFRIAGILNGTCNYILTRMENAGIDFGDALREAQNLGYAEADPTDDVEGYDARAKLVILAREGLGAQLKPDEVPCAPVTTIESVDFVYAHRLNCTIRQISRVQRGDDGGVLASVGPALVPSWSPLARTHGPQNLVTTTGRHGGETGFAGFGSGGDPTAVAVVSDLLAIAKRSDAPGWSAPAAIEPVTGDFQNPHYVRFTVKDRPGIIAALASAFSNHDINIDAVLQEPGLSKQALPFVVTLEECRVSTLASALGEIRDLDFHVRPPLDLPILSAPERRHGER